MKLGITIILLSLGLNAYALPANISASGLIHYNSDGGELPVSVALSLKNESGEKAKYQGTINLLENGKIHSQSLKLNISVADMSVVASTENYDLQGLINGSGLVLNFRQTVEIETCKTVRGSDGVRELVCNTKRMTVDQGQINLTLQ
jgi:hypothetical protein